MASRRRRKSGKVSSAALRAFIGGCPNWRWAAGQRIAKMPGAVKPADTLVQRVAAFASPRPLASPSDPELTAVIALQQDRAQTSRLKMLVVGGTRAGENLRAGGHSAAATQPVGIAIL